MRGHNLFYLATVGPNLAQEVLKDAQTQAALEHQKMATDLAFKMNGSAPMLYVPVRLAYYNELLEAVAELDALHAAGVENWEGYDFAMEGLNNKENDDDE